MINYRFPIRRLLAGSLSLLLLTSALNAQFAAVKTGKSNPGSLSKAEKALSKSIKLDSIKSFTRSLSADEMEGRGTLQPGGDKAAAWLADKFKSFGLKPLGDNGSYLQSIGFTEVKMSAATKFEAGGETFKFGKDYGFVPLPGPPTDSIVNGDVVFFGYGAQLFGDKAAESLQGIKGKTVLLVSGPPPNVSKKQWDESGSNMKIIQTLIIAGARSVLIVGNGSEDDQTEVYIDYFGRRQISMGGGGSSPAFAIPPILMINKKTARKLFKNAGMSFNDAQAKAEDKSFDAIDLKLQSTMVAKYETRKGTSSNVVAYLEGSDPALKAEAVLFSAHYDAYGVDNGKIYNGAADNALGTSEMLAVAEAYSKMNPKPRRSMIFIAVTGEEYGLYGSKYWADNPSWDLSKVVANLNLDGVGTEVFGPVKNMVGFGAEHSTLGPMLEDVAKSYGISLMPDPQPEEKVFTRSDHYSFVQKGVPALMLMGAPEGTADEIVKKIKAWEKVNYHQPTDDVMENWHWQGAKTVADMMGILGLRISNSDKAPTWFSSSPYSKIKR